MLYASLHFGKSFIEPVGQYWTLVRKERLLSQILSPPIMRMGTVSRDRPHCSWFFVLFFGGGGVGGGGEGELALISSMDLCIKKSIKVLKNLVRDEPPNYYIVIVYVHVLLLLQMATPTAGQVNLGSTRAATLMPSWFIHSQLPAWKWRFPLLHFVTSWLWFWRPFWFSS